MKVPEALVIGGGLAGSMLALELARNGNATALLERSKGPHHTVCGEFLSSEAIHYLRRHDIDLDALGAVTIRRIRLVLRKTCIEEALPFPARSLTRYVLDDALLQRAAAAGVKVWRECHADGLQRQSDMWSVAVRGGDAFHARDVFLATGKHDLRGWHRPAGTHHGLLAFKMYYQLTTQQHAAVSDTIELILFHGGYAGLQPVEGGRVNLCLLVNKEVLQNVGSNWTQLLAHILNHAPHLADRLQHATPLLDAPLAASHIPYGHVQADAPAGLWRLGDQAAVIPSFCGDGMAIALHSATLAARHYMQGDNSEIYQRQLRQQLGRRIAIAARLSQWMVAFPEAAQIARLFPGLLSRIAAMTRIPSEALLTE